MSRKHDDEKGEPIKDPGMTSGDRARAGEQPPGPHASPETGSAVPAPATTSMPGHPAAPPELQYRIAELEEVLDKHEQADRQNLTRITELENQAKHAEGQRTLELAERDRREAKLKEDNEALNAENAMFREALGKRAKEDEAADSGEDQQEEGSALVAEVLRPDGAALQTPMYLAKGKGLLWTHRLEDARRFRSGRDFNRALDGLREQNPDEGLIERLRPSVHAFGPNLDG